MPNLYYKPAKRLRELSKRLSFERFALPVLSELSSDELLFRTTFGSKTFPRDDLLGRFDSKIPRHRLDLAGRFVWLLLECPDAFDGILNSSK